jgi:hypothetical protein
MKKFELEKLVEDTINSMDGAQRAEPAPYLLTRINARLQRPAYSTWERISMILSRPGVAIAGATFLIIVNLAIFLTGNSSQDVKVPQSSQVSTDVYSYNTTSALYDLENITP